VDSILKPFLLSGDYNQHGIVDAADYTVWRDTLGSTSDLRADGDITGAAAGVVDLADYNIWKANFGAHAGSGADAGASSQIREPGGLELFVVGMRLNVMVRRRRNESSEKSRR
jgi:hypothetical protein